MTSPLLSSRDDDEIGLVGGDRLDVRRVAGELRHRRPRRIVRLVVDRDHLFAGADRKQVLGCGRRERDDPDRLRGERDLADRDREVHAGRRRRRPRDEEQRECESQGDRPELRTCSVTMKNLRVERREVARRREPQNRPSSEGWVRRHDAGDLARPRRAGHRSCGTAPGSHRLRCGLHRPGICARRGRGYRILQGVRAAILTIGNEVVSGDVANTNAAWLAQRLESLGVRVMLSAAVPDEIDAIAGFVNRERDARRPSDRHRWSRRHAGRPHTRSARGGVRCRAGEVPELAAELRARFTRHPDYAARWALLPVGSVPLRNPHGGAPASDRERLGTAGLPSEMEAMFDAYAEKLRGEQPIASWRRLSDRESDIVHLLAGATVRWPRVSIGSYPRFKPAGPEVEIVLKSADAGALAQAVAWLEPELDAVTNPTYS